MREGTAAAGLALVDRVQGAQLVLDIVGVEPTLRMAAQMARVGDHLTNIGAGGGATGL